jgi:hypothetical protein
LVIVKTLLVKVLEVPSHISYSWSATVATLTASAKQRSTTVIVKVIV